MPMFYLGLIAVLAFVVLVVYLVLTLNQLRRTMQRVDELVVNTDRELTPLLATLREASEQVREATVHLKRGSVKAESVLEAIGEVGDTIRSINQTVRGSACNTINQGMALWAGIKAFRNFFTRPQQP